MGVDDDEKTAAILELVTSGRSDRVVDAALAGAPPAANEALRFAREAFAAVGLEAAPRAPSAGLRARIVSSLAARHEPRRAVLVVDMLNDHLTPGRPLEVPRAREIVPALASFLDGARAEGNAVVYVCDEHDPADVDLDSWGAHNVKGTEGAEVWPALAPHTADLVVHKPTYSGFTGSRLDEVLAGLRVDTLVLTGCLTEVGVLATATDALQRGYAVEVPPATQAGASEVNENVALGVLRLLTPYGPARAALLARLGDPASLTAPASVAP